MISYANKKYDAYGVKSLILDADDDVKKLPTNIAAGSTAFVLSSSKTYKINSQGEWIEIKSMCGSGGNGDGDTITDIIYDGGLI